MKKEAKKQKQQQRATEGRSHRVKFMVIAVLAVAAAAYAFSTFAPAPATSYAPPPAAAGFERISVDDLKKLYDAGSVTIIDVRTIEDYAREHIPGALQIPLSRVEGEIAYLPKDKAIVTYCTCPNEESSGAAVEILQRAGIRNAYALTGGLVPWRKSGYPVETGLK